MSESDTWGEPWSDNPNAPQISYWWYRTEKTTFAGAMICAMLYGINVVLFFQCIMTFLDPAKRPSGGVKWGFVAHTGVMFALVTVFTAINLDILSDSFIDNREFPGMGDILPPGPIGYQYTLLSKAFGRVSDVTFFLNNWLAGGLLLYRCCVLYSMSYWVIALPCVMYLASVATGIAFFREVSRPSGSLHASPISTGLPYFSISTSINALLTLMIAARLLLRSRNIKRVMGAQAGTNGIYRTIVVILIESSALYAVTSLLCIGTWGTGRWVAPLFLPILGETQAIAPFLIILRVANQSALTSDTVAHGGASSLHFRTPGESVGGAGDNSDGNIPSPAVGVQEKTPGEVQFGIRVETMTDIHRDNSKTH